MDIIRGHVRALHFTKWKMVTKWKKGTVLFFMMLRSGNIAGLLPTSLSPRAIEVEWTEDLLFFKSQKCLIFTITDETQSNTWFVQTSTLQKYQDSQKYSVIKPNDQWINQFWSNSILKIWYQAMNNLAWLWKYFDVCELVSYLWHRKRKSKMSEMVWFSRFYAALTCLSFLIIDTRILSIF